MEKTNVPRNHSPAMRPGFRSNSILTPFVSRPRHARDRRANDGYPERHSCGRAIARDTPEPRKARDLQASSRTCIWKATVSRRPAGPVGRGKPESEVCHLPVFLKSVRHAPPCATVYAMQPSSGWNDESMRIVVLSDTHAPRFWKRCPPGVAEHLFAAEVILHAGDVCVASVLEELSAYAPVHAVLGNNDA